MAQSIVTTSRARGAAERKATQKMEVDKTFSEFREHAVRLVERLDEIAGGGDDQWTSVQNDLELARTIFGKWSGDLLLMLHTVPSSGFEELRRSMPGISPRVLSMKLKELEVSGMVQRDVLDSRPPRAKYSLTQRGWNATWLAQPILLFLRLSQESSLPARTPAETAAGRRSR